MGYNRLSEFLLKKRYKKNIIYPYTFLLEGPNLEFFIIVVNVDDMSIIEIHVKLSKNYSRLF